MAAIALTGVSKTYPGGHAALHRLDLDIHDGERLVLVGPSGSGKSTVLRIIAGLELPTSGTVAIDGRDVTGVPPERRDLAMVFQSYALYPHKTVRQNLAFGLRVRRLSAAEIARRVAATAESLGLAPLLDRFPAQLSGGQRQRVALGRAIARDPQAFLLDEPLSNLDPRLRGDTRAELVALHGRLRATMVYVTHDQEEAMTLGQRIAVLNGGELEQLAAPDELYRRPATAFVAGFIGSPAMNLVPPAALRVPAPPDATLAGIRPHDVTLGEAGSATVMGTIELVEPLGHAQIVHIRADALRLVVVAPPEPRLAPGETIHASVDRERLHFFGPAGKRIERP